MTIHYVLNGGILRHGMLNGVGSVFDEDMDTGSGIIKIGTCIKNKLNGPGKCISFNNTGFTLYEGTFENDIKQGVFNVYTYSGVEGPTNINIVGNGTSSQNGILHIQNSINQTDLTCSKDIIEYLDNVSINTTNELPVLVNISIIQKEFNGRRLFKAFDITF